MVRPRSAFDRVILLCGLFWVLTIIAACTYPGTSFSDLFGGRDGDVFAEHLLSNLGRVAGFSGATLVLWDGVFVIAICAAALATGLLFIMLSRRFSDGAAQIVGRAGAACGVVSGLSLIAVACTSWNALQVRDPLWLLTLLAFLAASLLSSTASMLDRGTLKSLAASLAVPAVLWAMIAMLIVWLDFYDTSFTGSNMAKLALYGIFGTMILQADGAARLAPN